MSNMPIREGTWLTDRYTAVRDWVRTYVDDPQAEALAEALLVQAVRLAMEGTGPTGGQLPSAAFANADMATRFLQLFDAHPIDWDWVEALSADERLAYAALEANFSCVFMSPIMRDYPQLVSGSEAR